MMNDKCLVISDIIYNKVLDPAVRLDYMQTFGEMLEEDSLYFCTCRVNGTRYYQYIIVTQEFENAKDPSTTLDDFLTTMMIRSAKRHYQKDQSREAIK